MKSSKMLPVIRLLVISVLSLACVSYGSGFSILEQSAAGLGRSLAGMTAETSDPSALFFNAASAAWFEKAEISLGTHFLHARAFYDDRGSEGFTGNNGGNMGGWSYIPNVYLVYPVANGISLGLGMSATSGTRTEYDSKWIGRYLGVETDIAVMELNPVIAWKIRDDLSIGIGGLIHHADVTLSQAVNFSNFGRADGQMKVEGDSWAYGFTLGVLYQPVNGTRLGLGYRSRMTQDLELDARVRGVPAILTGMGLKSASSGEAELNLPSMINFGIQQDLGEKWTVMADISWTEWSVMDELTVEFDRPILGQDGSTMKTKWDDTWRFAIGGEYKWSEALTLRCGFAYDQTPVSSEDTRVVRMPDADRYWASVGIGYKFTENIRLALAYTHIFFDTVKLVSETPDGTLRGKVGGSADIISVAIGYTF
ncbi:MAG: hypothetical protein GX937_04745 [Lentisphaerae bacterium]|nr:hypothetical protein [Lentisphaerota bacterium]